MNIFQLAILAGAGTVALVSRNLPHAVMWIVLGAVVAVACDLFYSFDLPYPAAFTLACDALLCLSIHWFAKERWESLLFLAFQLSVLVSLLRLVGWIGDEGLYRLGMELCNWLALLLIGGTAILGGAGGHAFRNSWAGYFRGAYRYLREPPPTPHWRKIKA